MLDQYIEDSIFARGFLILESVDGFIEFRLVRPYVIGEWRWPTAEAGFRAVYIINFYLHVFISTYTDISCTRE